MNTKVLQGIKNDNLISDFVFSQYHLRESVGLAFAHQSKDPSLVIFSQNC